METVGGRASRIAVYLAYVLSGFVVVAGLAWSAGGYLLGEDMSFSGLFAAVPLSFAVTALAMMWLGVFVVFVIAKAFRVGGQL